LTLELKDVKWYKQPNVNLKHDLIRNKNLWKLNKDDYVCLFLKFENQILSKFERGTNSMLRKSLRNKILRNKKL